MNARALGRSVGVILREWLSFVWGFGCAVMFGFLYNLSNRLDAFFRVCSGGCACRPGGMVLCPVADFGDFWVFFLLF